MATETTYLSAADAMKPLYNVGRNVWLPQPQTKLFIPASYVVVR